MPKRLASSPRNGQTNSLALADSLSANASWLLPELDFQLGEENCQVLSSPLCFHSRISRQCDVAGSARKQLLELCLSSRSGNCLD